MLEKLVKKIEELQQVGIIKKWKMGTLGYNGDLELEFQGEIIENGDVYTFSDYIMIDEEAMDSLEKKLHEITEAAKNYFEIEL